jgi:hypothetical protein
LSGRASSPWPLDSSDVEFPSHSYDVTLEEPGTVAIQASRLYNPFGDEAPDLTIELREPVAFLNFGFSDHPSNLDELLVTDAPAGNFQLDVISNTDLLTTAYTLAISTDFAPGVPVRSAGAVVGFNAASARQLGTLSEAAGQDVRDFIGFLDGSDRAGVDQFDVNAFTVPASGTVTINLDGLEQDAAG